MHSFGFVGTIPYCHGTLDGHEDTDGFGGVGEIHGDEMEKRIHDYLYWVLRPDSRWQAIRLIASPLRGLLL